MKKKIYGTSVWDVHVHLKEDKGPGEDKERFSFKFFIDSSATYTEIKEASREMASDVLQMNLKVRWIITSIDITGVSE